MNTPRSRFPEMTLRSTAVMPPITVFVAPWTRMPWLVLPTSPTTPAGSAPRWLPATVVPVPPSTAMPVSNRLTANPRIDVPPAVTARPLPPAVEPTSSTTGVVDQPGWVVASSVAVAVIVGSGDRRGDRPHAAAVPGVGDRDGETDLVDDAARVRLFDRGAQGALGVAVDGGGAGVADVIARVRVGGVAGRVHHDRPGA